MINQYNGAIRYTHLNAQAPAVKDFSSVSEKGRVYFADGQDDEVFGQFYPDLRANMQQVWFLSTGFARYNLTTTLGGYRLQNTDNWPKPGYALRLPRLVRFIIVVFNDDYFDYKTMAEEIRTDFEDRKNIWCNIATFPDDDFPDEPPFDLRNNRWIAACSPQLKDADTFLGTDVLNIVILNKYNVPWYWDEANYAISLNKTHTDFPSIVTETFAQWKALNRIDIDNYKAAYKKFRRSAVWVFMNDRLPDIPPLVWSEFEGTIREGDDYVQSSCVDELQTHGFGLHVHVPCGFCQDLEFSTPTLLIGTIGRRWVGLVNPPKAVTPYVRCLHTCTTLDCASTGPNFPFSRVGNALYLGCTEGDGPNSPNVDGFFQNSPFDLGCLQEDDLGSQTIANINIAPEVSAANVSGAQALCTELVDFGFEFKGDAPTNSAELLEMIKEHFELQD